VYVARSEPAAGAAAGQTNTLIVVVGLGPTGRLTFGLASRDSKQNWPVSMVPFD
jgi:hypothetical protein